MELANLTLSVGADVDHTVPKRSVTPAEALLLATIHKARKKGHPLSDIKIIGTAQSVAKAAEFDEDGTQTKDAEYRPRTSQEEVARLRTLYHKKHIDLLYPLPTSKVPDTFAEAEALWKEVPNAAAEQGQIGNWTDVPGSLPLQKGEAQLQKANTEKANAEKK